MMVIAVIFVPTVMVYANYGDQYDTSESLYGTFAKFSLGSLGESDFRCENHFLQLNRTQKFQCNTGSIQPLKHVGLLPFKEDTLMPYTMDFCGSKKVHSEVETCSDWFLNEKDLRDNFE